MSGDHGESRCSRQDRQQPSTLRVSLFFLLLLGFFILVWESYGRGLNDGGSLDNLLLVELGTGTVKVADDGGHTGLVTHVGGQVNGLLGVILREAVLSLILCTFRRSRPIVVNTHDLTFPLFLAALLRGKNAREP